MEKDRTSYWVSRFEQDGKNLPEEQKVALLRAVGIHLSSLSDQEADVFFAPDAAVTSDDLDKMMVYARAEQKIAKTFSDAFPQPGTAEFDEQVNKSQAFRTDFRSTLSSFYTEGELDEIISGMTYRDEAFVVKLLVGSDHPLWKRIRNAYIPEITDITLLSPQGPGQNVTAKVFDGPGDAVSQLEKFLSRRSY